MVAFLHKCEICHLGRVRGTTQRFRGGDLTISCHPWAPYDKAKHCIANISTLQHISCHPRASFDRALYGKYQTSKSCHPGAPYGKALCCKYQHSISCHPRASYGKSLYCKSEMAGYIAIVMAQYCIAERPVLGGDFGMDISMACHDMALRRHV